MPSAPRTVVPVGHENAPSVLRRVREETWDLVLLDLSMPGAEGIETLRRIRAHAPDLPVLVFTVHPEAQLTRQVLEVGGGGYVEKEASPEDLVR